MICDLREQETKTTSRRAQNTATEDLDKQQQPAASPAAATSAAEAHHHSSASTSLCIERAQCYRPTSPTRSPSANYRAFIGAACPVAFGSGSPSRHAFCHADDLPSSAMLEAETSRDCGDYRDCRRCRVLAVPRTVSSHSHTASRVWPFWCRQSTPASAQREATEPAGRRRLTPAAPFAPVPTSPPAHLEQPKRSVRPQRQARLPTAAQACSVNLCLLLAALRE